MVEVIGLADKSVQENKREVEDRLVYHELGLLSIAGPSKSGVRLSSLDDVVSATR